MKKYHKTGTVAYASSSGFAVVHGPGPTTGDVPPKSSSPQPAAAKPAGSQPTGGEAAEGP